MSAPVTEIHSALGAVGCVGGAAQRELESSWRGTVNSVARGRIKNAGAVNKPRQSRGLAPPRGGTGAKPRTAPALWCPRRDPGEPGCQSRICLRSSAVPQRDSLPAFPETAGPIALRGAVRRNRPGGGYDPATPGDSDRVTAMWACLMNCASSTALLMISAQAGLISQRLRAASARAPLGDRCQEISS
ncbi:hypothetical protein AAFF_G00167390 [Aldrovandia affinis]|uniref:Uncharacterized protein n=1 Tax=Aldrovandia affinis TaxID=143900 RepID=A0AAD7W810_9TELE|nr:hypothetical protein AAFF_G00167390 [Aldrovandia affinis]